MIWPFVVGNLISFCALMLALTSTGAYETLPAGRPRKSTWNEVLDEVRETTCVPLALADRGFPSLW